MNSFIIARQGRTNNSRTPLCRRIGVHHARLRKSILTCGRTETTRGWKSLSLGFIAKQSYFRTRPSKLRTRRSSAAAFDSSADDIYRKSQSQVTSSPLLNSFTPIQHLSRYFVHFVSHLQNIDKMPLLTLVRHGETKLNRAQVVQSRTPGELTEKGVKMAELLGQQLHDEKWTLIFTSDLKRCHDTTLNILKHSKHSQPDVQLKEILRERDYGDLEFQPGETVMELIRKYNLPNHKVPIPGGEPYEKVIERCHQFFEEICDIVDSAEGEDHNILVVSHGAWILTFLDYLHGHPQLFELLDYNHEDATEKKPVLNTTNTKIHIEKIAPRNNNQLPKRRIKFYHYHCAKHLEGLED